MKGFLGWAIREIRRWRRWAPRLGGACVLTLSAVGCAPEDYGSCGSNGAPDPDCEAPLPLFPEGSNASCPLGPFEDSPTGICKPLVDNGWDLGLFRMAYVVQGELLCPDEAPNAGLTGVEVPLDGSLPRNVIGCSINPYNGCRSGGLVCVPYAQGFQTCASQDGPQECPNFWYPEETTVEKDGEGGEAAVCCQHESDGPEG